MKSKRETPTARLLEQLRVYATDTERATRLRGGPSSDGGYVLLDAGLDQIERFYSYGVSDNYAFDSWLHGKTGALGRLFDPTVDYHEVIEPGLHFRKLGLGVADGSINDHVSLFNDHGKRMLLKVDIEGSEWSWLSRTEESELCQFDQILLELHGLEDSSRHDDFAACLSKITRNFHLFHVHANNFYSLIPAEGGFLPCLLECSYIRKDLVSAVPNEDLQFPLPDVDAPNVSEIPDVPLDFWPFISRRSPDVEMRSIEAVRCYIEAHKLITSQRKKIKSLRFELDCMRRSGSWRWTAPVRAISKSCARLLSGRQ